MKESEDLSFSDRQLKEYRYLFPVTKNWIYLNHAGVAPISRRVADAVTLFNQQALYEGYTASKTWTKHIEKTRSLCGLLINAHADEIAFVKNTSHGISLIARGLHFQAGDEIITSDLEFPSNVYPWMALEKQGVVLKKVSSQHGKFDLEQLKSLVTSRTKLVALSSVQYGTGFRLPWNEVGKFCRENGIYFFLDAIQSLGAIPLDVQEANVDFLSADAHKWMLGHEGIGLLYVRRDLISQLEPVLLGWNSVLRPHQFDVIDFELAPTARRFEEGSYNGLSIYGLGAAVELLLEAGVSKIQARIIKLNTQLVQGLQDLGCQIMSPLEASCRSGIVTMRLPDGDLEKLYELEQFLMSEKVYASIRRESLRFSPHFYNSEDEMEKVAELVKEFLSK